MANPAPQAAASRRIEDAGGRSSRWRAAPALVMALGLVAASACASAPPPREELALAREKLETARSQQAAAFAELELRKAQAELDAAEQAMEDERNVEARRKAELAAAHADLALAKAEQAQNREAAEELRETVSALEREIQRGRLQGGTP